MGAAGLVRSVLTVPHKDLSGALLSLDGCFLPSADELTCADVRDRSRQSGMESLRAPNVDAGARLL